jgi:hypothetical protein
VPSESAADRRAGGRTISSWKVVRSAPPRYTFSAPGRGVRPAWRAKRSFHRDGNVFVS